MAWLPKQTVVVPVDFSESSSDAVQTSLQLVARPEDLHVVHVLLPLDYLAPGALTGSYDESSRKADAEKRLADFLKTHGAEKCPSTVRLGDPGLDITEFANELHADLIVIPSHGYQGVKRFLLGSVAERVIRHAECAVLVLRRRDAE